MSAEKPLDFELNALANSELDKQTVRTGFHRDTLQRLAEVIAAIAPDRDPSWYALQPEDVAKAADMLPNIKQLLKTEKTVFLSYATPDLLTARTIHAKLTSGKDRVNCFMAPEIDIGEAFREAIWENLRNCRLFVILVSKYSMDSEWCLAEVGAAAVLKKNIVQVRIDPNCELPAVVATLQSTSLQLPKQIGRLAKQLKTLCMN